MAIEMLDDETVRWLRDEAFADGDGTLGAACERALVGNAVAIETVREALATRVGRAHREHRRRGLCS